MDFFSILTTFFSNYEWCILFSGGQQVPVMINAYYIIIIIWNIHLITLNTIIVSLVIRNCYEYSNSLIKLIVSIQFDTLLLVLRILINQVNVMFINSYSATMFPLKLNVDANGSLNWVWHRQCHIFVRGKYPRWYRFFGFWWFNLFKVISPHWGIFNIRLLFHLFLYLSLLLFRIELRF